MKLTHATDFYIRVIYVIKLLYLNLSHEITNLCKNLTDRNKEECVRCQNYMWKIYITVDNKYIALSILCLYCRIRIYM